MTTSRVDDVLAGVEPQISKEVIDNEIPEPVKEEIVESKSDVKEEAASSDAGDDLDNTANSGRDTDEYGNAIPKAKIYTEEEVNARINEAVRRRLKEGREAPRVVEQQVDNNASATDTGENWEQQLENVVENTLKKVSQKKEREQYENREQEIQMQFEDKFNRGMSRYGDFVEVVRNQPITNSMMMATRSMQDPAAFIYAASKTQAKELERIAKIPDPYQQVAEMARLDERMRKARSGTNAPRPLAESKGDIPNRTVHRGTIDELIQHDAKRKLSRR